MARGKSALAICAAGIGLLLFAVPLRHVALNDMTGLGLVSVLPVASIAGLALLVVAFIATLARRRPRPAILATMLLAVVCCIDGAAAIAEPLPRFATAYQIAGFVGYIGHTGHVVPGAEAYFSWPGFFALIAFAAHAAGVHSLLPLLTWWPVIIDALCLLPFLLITRSLGLSWRARWLAALLFCVGNWVGQDYFSPQSFNYLLYLTFVAILLTWFGGRHGGSEGEVAGRGQRAILLALLIGIFVVSTISHQLTPFLMLATCAGLVIVRRCTLRGLPVLLGVILVGWVSFGTVAYWSGHLSTIFGAIGHLGANVSASVGDRVIGTPVHQVVLHTRLLLPVTMAGLAVLGVLRRRRAGAGNRALLVLLCVPLIAVALQNYGGEIALRVYLFALPAAAMLAASLFFPEASADGAETSAGAAQAIAGSADAGGSSPASVGDRTAGSRTSLRRVIAAGLTALSLTGMFFVARYGNEAFERTPPGELAAMNYIYDHANGGISVLWLSQPANVNATPEMPWQYRDITSVQFVARTASRRPASVAGALDQLRGLGRGSFLITTATEAAYLRQTGSYPADWASKFRAAMAATPGVRVVMANRTAAVYALRLPAGAPRAKAPVSIGPVTSRHTGWTPIGLAALALALLALAGREFTARCLRPGRSQRSRLARQRLVRLLALASVPLVMLLLIAVAERFAVLS